MASRLERDDAPSSSGSPDEEPAQDEEAKAGPSSSLAEFLAEAGPSKLSSLYTRIISRTWQGEAASQFGVRIVALPSISYSQASNLSILLVCAEGYSDNILQPGSIVIAAGWSIAHYSRAVRLQMPADCRGC